MVFTGSCVTGLVPTVAVIRGVPFQDYLVPWCLTSSWDQSVNELTTFRLLAGDGNCVGASWKSSGICFCTVYFVLGSFLLCSFISCCLDMINFAPLSTPNHVLLCHPPRTTQSNDCSETSEAKISPCSFSRFSVTIVHTDRKLTNRTA